MGSLAYDFNVDELAIFVIEQSGNDGIQDVLNTGTLSYVIMRVRYEMNIEFVRLYCWRSVIHHILAVNGADE
ncbi:hypothetical protein HanPSC8_Chr09g0374091 [Helianthus annuus]|nr:hypothetical protein HanPSC8_Chr09g0374091 [Helianthus annuus]